MRLPPLNALRAFEAAARHGGYSGAAEELFVTRGAVSRHVKQLEEHLGVLLFNRLPQGVELTDAGARFLPVLTSSFEAIAKQARELTRPRDELSVICPPTFSIRWLIPKLDDFRQRHPEIRVQLTTAFFSAEEFEAGGYDFAVGCDPTWGEPHEEEALQLFPMAIAPACTPALAERLKRPQDLARETLLHEKPTHHDWRAWCDAFPVEGLDPGKGIELPSLDMSTKAALMGKGVLMADLILTRDELESDQLVMPFPDMIAMTDWGDFALRISPGRSADPKVKAFTDWVLEAAAPDLAYCQERLAQVPNGR